MKKSILILMFIITAAVIYGNIGFSPETWEFGTINRGTVITNTITFTNTGKTPVHIRIIPTCECITSQPGEFDLASGVNGNVAFVLDSKEESGEIEKMFIIETDLETSKKLYYSITGKVIGADEIIEAEPTAESGKQEGAISFTYFYDPRCAVCKKFLESSIPSLEKELNISIVINKKDIFDKTVLSEFDQKMSTLGEKQRAFPVFILGNKVLQGDDEIEKNIKDVMKAYLADPDSFTVPENKGTTGQTQHKEITLLAVITGGLIDGINPCAFATLISLLTALALAGKQKKEILIMGFFFTLSVFITYYTVGVLLFMGFGLVNSFAIGKTIFHWVLIAVLVVFAGLSLYDFYLIRAGRSTEMVLQLPDNFKKRIQKTIKTQARSAAIVISSIILGFLVSLFELGCTGQVYFPTIGAMIGQNDLFGYFLLLIYNLGFVTPLVGVFVITYTGISTKQITGLLQKYMGVVKILLALFFIGLAVYMIFVK